jgi:transposase InsO family protein
MLRSDASTGDYRSTWKEAILCNDIIAFEHTPGAANVVADSLSRAAIVPDAISPDSIQPEWEAVRGLRNDLYEVAVRKIGLDEAAILQQRFEGDALQDIVDILLHPRNPANADDEVEEWTLLQEAARLYYISDGQLRRLIRNTPVTVLPGVEGIFVLRDTHESNGHFGRDLVLAEVTRSYLWPGMCTQVDQVIAECSRCKQFGQRFQRLLLMPVVRFRPFQTVAMDYLSMPKGRGGHDTILVAIDLFSKFVVASSFKGPAGARHTITMLDTIRSHLLTPDEILTDNGTHFQNQAVATWCTTNHCRQTFAAAYAHVGSVENANRLVLERLRRLCNVDINLVPKPSDVDAVSWVVNLQDAVRFLNDRKVKFLAGLSPCEVLFGMESPVWSGSDGSIQLRLVQMDQARIDVAVAYTAEQEHRKSTSKQWNTYEPAIGDIVATYYAAGDRSYSTMEKLRPKWQGPFRVTDVRRRAVRVAHLDGLPREGWIGWARLKPWV